jgi:hypothetical protein
MGSDGWDRITGQPTEKQGRNEVGAASRPGRIGPVPDRGSSRAPRRWQRKAEDFLRETTAASAAQVTGRYTDSAFACERHTDSLQAQPTTR